MFVPSSIMNGTDVSITVLERLSDEWDGLTPEAQKVARYVLENPQDVGVSTVRELADYAQVKPNTVVRMARQVGFEGYEDFREPFRQAIRKGSDFPDRARWLQDVRKRGEMGELYADIVSAAIRNVEDTFAGISERLLKEAAEAIWHSDNVYTLGVGVNNANARNFTYLASTGMVRFHAIPRAGSTPIDDLAWAGRDDILIAITQNPYRSEVVDTVSIAREQGMKIIGISDSPASPVILNADYKFIVATDAPNFFPSSTATVALLEALLSFVIAVSDEKIIDRVEKFHRRRHDLGIYSEAQK